LLDAGTLGVVEALSQLVGGGVQLLAVVPSPIRWYLNSGRYTLVACIPAAIRKM